MYEFVRKIQIKCVNDAFSANSNVIERMRFLFEFFCSLERKIEGKDEDQGADAKLGDVEVILKKYKVYMSCCYYDIHDHVS
jgi:hypothetical protein